MKSYKIIGTLLFSCCVASNNPCFSMYNDSPDQNNNRLAIQSAAFKNIINQTLKSIFDENEEIQNIMNEFENDCKEIIRSNKDKAKKIKKIKECLERYKTRFHQYLEMEDKIDEEDKGLVLDDLKKCLAQMASIKIKALSPTMSPSPNTPNTPQ